MRVNLFVCGTMCVREKEGICACMYVFLCVTVCESE